MSTPWHSDMSNVHFLLTLFNATLTHVYMVPRHLDNIVQIPRPHSGKETACMKPATER